METLCPNGPGSAEDNAVKNYQPQQESVKNKNMKGSKSRQFTRY